MSTTAIQHPAPSAQMLRSGKSLGPTIEGFYDVIADKYTPAQRDVLAFWFEHARDKSLGLAELHRITGVSSTTLTRLFRGIYEGSVESQIAKLSHAREHLVDAVDNPDFITTSLSRKMYAVFDKTRALRNVTIMWGAMGIGKSTVIREYQRTHNHGLTYAVRCPGYGCTAVQFMRHVAASMRIATGGHGSDYLRERILAMLSKGNRLLIIDELHQVFRTCAPGAIVRICEWLREIQETADCGLALTGTELLRKEFFEGVHASVLAQLVDRGTVQIPLGSKPTKGDIAAFLKNYQLDLPTGIHREADEIIQDIIRSNGLRKLTLHLRDGKAYANKREEDYTWDHFTAAFKDIQSLSK